MSKNNDSIKELAKQLYIKWAMIEGQECWVEIAKLVKIIEIEARIDELDEIRSSGSALEPFFNAVARRHAEIRIEQLQRQLNTLKGSKC